MKWVTVAKHSCQFVYTALLIWLISASVSATSLEDLAHLVDSGDADRALLETEKYLKAHPGDYTARFLKARLLARQGKLDDSNTIYKALIRQQPERPEAYNNLAMQLASQGDLSQAQQVLEQALATHEGYATVYKNLSAIYVEMARDSYGKALRLKSAKHSLSLKELAMPGPATVQKQVQTAQVTTKPPLSVPEAKSKPVAVAQSTDTHPAAAKTVKTVVADEQTIINTLNNWATAWSGQEVDQYLNYYHNNYSPPGMTRKYWKWQRAERIRRPGWIKVVLKDFSIEAIGNDRARVRLLQDYKASNYQDITKKEFQLVATPDGWRIVQEESLAE